MRIRRRCAAGRARTIPNVTVSDEFSDGKGGRAGECHARAEQRRQSDRIEEGAVRNFCALPPSLSLSLSAKPKANFENAKRTDGRRE